MKYMKKTIVLILVLIISLGGICYAGGVAEEPETSAEEETEEGSLSQVIESIASSQFHIENLFILIADIVDIANGNGESTPAGNIIRAAGTLISALMSRDESAVKNANSQLVRELILADNKLSELSNGIILDIYEASRDELIRRGMIDAPEDNGNVKTD